MKRICEPFAYGVEPVAAGYWPTTVSGAPAWPRIDGDLRADIAIIGGGFTGLTAALHLAEAGADVALLEAETPGWGASGRNGGFCCLGGARLDAGTLVRRYGEADTRLFFDAERHAVALVAETLDRLGHDVDSHSHGETILAHRPEAVAILREAEREARGWHGVASTFLDRADLAAAGLGSPEFHAALTIPIGFALNPLKYSLGLAHAAQSAGARIFAHSPATRIARAGGGWALQTPGGTVTAKKIVIATNGYSSEDLPPWLGGRYLPAQSNILVTRPLTESELAAQGWTSLQMSYDTRNLLHYFRLMPDKRMLFGLRGALRATPASHTAIRARARADFDRMFPAWRAVETPFFWSGLVAFSRSFVPFVGAVPGEPNAFAGLCYHGNGVAFGSHAGALLADLVLGRAARGPYPALIARPPGRFPLGRLRRALLVPAYRWYGWRDGA